MKGYCIACLLLLFNVCSISWGQVPPYQHTKTLLLRERLKTNYYQKSPIRTEEWMRSYKREDIPMFTLFAYDSISDFDMESKLQRFYYRKYCSFTAPKGVRKITYYLGNSWIDSIQESTHVFFFNRKTQRLEKEIQYDKNDFNLQSYDQVKKREYKYQYEETKEEITVTKFENTKNGLLFLSQYVYSKDKSRLLRNKFKTLDYQLDLLRQHIDTTVLNKNVEFKYDEYNKLREIVYQGSIDYESGFNFKKENFTWDFSTYDDYTHGWSKKENWLSFMNNDEEEEGESILFPTNLDLKFINGYSFSYEDKGNKEILNPAEQSLTVRMQHSSNIYNSFIQEIDKYQNTKSSQYYLDHKILLFDESIHLSNAYMVSNYHLSFSNQPMWNITDNTPMEYLFLTKRELKNQYSLLYIQKNIPLMPPLVHNWFWHKDYFSTFKAWQDLKNEEYIVELKSKKGLNEIYLIHNNVKRPLITIN